MTRNISSFLLEHFLHQSVEQHVAIGSNHIKNMDMMWNRYVEQNVCNLKNIQSYFLQRLLSIVINSFAFFKLQINNVASTQVGGVLLG